MAVKIYADAGIDLSPEIIKAKGLDIKIVNMKLYIKEQEYNYYDDMRKYLNSSTKNLRAIITSILA